jgi:hypothetical protein
MTITANTLADLVNRGNSITNDTPQFERWIWAVRAESFGLLAEATRAFLGQFGNLDVRATQLAREYLDADANNGLVMEKVQPLFDAVTAFLTTFEPDQSVLDLMQAANRTLQLGDLYNKSVAIFNRSTGFRNMPERPSIVALRNLYEQWATENHVHPDPLPDSPYYQGTTVILRASALDETIAEGNRIATDAAVFANEVRLIRDFGLNWLIASAEKFLDLSDVAGTQAQAAALELLRTRTPDLAPRLVSTISGYLQVFGPKDLAIMVAGIATWVDQLNKLLVQADEFNSRVRPFWDIRKHAGFEALSYVFNVWLERKLQEQALRLEPAEAV